MNDASGDPASLSALDAASAIRSRRLSSRELVDACLTRVAARDGAIGAWDFLDPRCPGVKRSRAMPPATEVVRCTACRSA